MADFNDNFEELVGDKKTGQLREKTRGDRAQGALDDLAKTRRKTGVERLSDAVTEPYAGTQGKGKEWAKDIQAADESPRTPKKKGMRYFGSGDEK